MNKKSPNKWEEKIGFNFDEEFDKYFSIYGEKELPQNRCKKLYNYLKNIGKPNIDHKDGFETFTEWEMYVLEKYSCYDEEILSEFQYFLEFKKGTSEILDGLWVSLVIPFAVTILVNCVSNSKLIEGETIKITLFVILIVIVLFKWFFKKLLAGCLMQGRYRMFFEDFYKIINKICENKTKSQENFEVLL